jgi:peptidoglycan hydrolase-like protein with peptidoglycan-binding domain
MATTEPLSTKDLLLKGSKGIKVSQLQDALLAYPIKFSIPESSAIKALRGALTAAPASKGLYGNLTEAAVKDFQNYVRNTLDKTVIVDGKAGPITLPFLLGQPPQQAPTQPSNTYTPITIQQASGKGTFRTITGVVRDKITQQPMANVDVFFQSRS